MRVFTIKLDGAYSKQNSYTICISSQIQTNASCNSLDKTKFQVMIKEIQGKREAKIIKISICMLFAKPEIVKIFAD